MWSLPLYSWLATMSQAEDFCFEIPANTGDLSPWKSHCSPSWALDDSLQDSGSHLLHLAPQAHLCLCFTPILCFSFTIAVFVFEAGVHDVALAALQLLHRAGWPWPGISHLPQPVLASQPLCLGFSHPYFSHLLFWG